MISFGITQFLKDRIPKQRVGLLTHAHARDEMGMSTYDRICAHPNITIGALFSPQHGFFLDTSQAQMVPTPSSRHPQTGIPIYSLYRPEGRDVNPEWLRNLDAVVIDLPDVGVKVYTYIWSMAKMMESCAKTQTPVVILDRPNPISGFGIKGPVTCEEYTSFIGLYPIGFCHAMTIGEIAQYVNSFISCPLTVIPMAGWRRDSFWDDLALPWSAPSPNLRTLEAALHYPATVMMEATNLSEGRGTDAPFCVVGAPFMSPQKVMDALQTHTIPGYSFAPISFVPDSDKYAGQRCHGLRLHITDRRIADPVWMGCMLIRALIATTPEFAFRDPPYEYEYQRNPFDITVGDGVLRKLLESEASDSEIEHYLDTSAHRFQESRNRFLLYD